MAQLISFDSKTKAKCMRRIRAHMKADEVVQRLGYQNGKGCAVGCTLNTYDHGAYERELGIPIALAWLEDALHEGQSLRRAKKWPERFLRAVPVRKDLSTVLDRWFVWLLKIECPSESGRMVAALYERKLGGDIPTIDEWREAAARAWEAAAAATTRSYARMADKLIEILEDT